MRQAPLDADGASRTGDAGDLRSVCSPHQSGWGPWSHSDGPTEARRSIEVAFACVRLLRSCPRHRAVHFIEEDALKQKIEESVLSDLRGSRTQGLAGRGAAHEVRRNDEYAHKRQPAKSRD